MLVIGAGFGGLAAALRLAEAGVDVRVCEALSYPGGCASTFDRGGHRYETAATLFSGLDRDGLFGRWIEKYGLDVAVEWPDPIVELRTPSHQLVVSRRREDLIEQICATSGAPRDRLQRFFSLQSRVAEVLWELFDEPELLPPLRWRALLTHLRRARGYLPLLNLVGRPLSAVLRHHGLERFEPLRSYLDALCQITMQCGVDEAEAPFALAAMDYYHRGSGHVRGGIGHLAEELVRAIESCGGVVHLTERVEGIERKGSEWRVQTRRCFFRARQVVANVLPQDLRRLLSATEGELRRLDHLAERVERGWGACMLYLVVGQSGGSDRHLQIVQDPGVPLIEGNHLFASPSGRGTWTVSTHVSLEPPPEASRIAAIQERMREGLRRYAPELWNRVEGEMTASPRTFERFTGRQGGLVGGVPRRAGLRNYTRLAPRAVSPGLYLVGDSVFPGQSILATALGGTRLAEMLVRR